MPQLFLGTPRPSCQAHTKIKKLLLRLEYMGAENERITHYYQNISGKAALVASGGI
jgi:hypothetical protein